MNKMGCDKKDILTASVILGKVLTILPICMFFSSALPPASLNYFLGQSAPKNAGLNGVFYANGSGGSVPPEPGLSIEGLAQGNAGVVWGQKAVHQGDETIIFELGWQSIGKGHILEYPAAYGYFLYSCLLG